MIVRLESVTRDNWEEVIKIDLPPEQWAMVDPPSVLHALCECQFYPSLASYAVMDGDALVLVGYMAAGRVSTRAGLRPTPLSPS